MVGDQQGTLRRIGRVAGDDRRPTVEHDHSGRQDRERPDLHPGGGGLLERLLHEPVSSERVQAQRAQAYSLGEQVRVESPGLLKGSRRRLVGDEGGDLVPHDAHEIADVRQHVVTIGHPDDRLAAALGLPVEVAQPVEQLAGVRDLLELAGEPPLLLGDDGPHGRGRIDRPPPPGDDLGRLDDPTGPEVVEALRDRSRGEPEVLGHIAGRRLGEGDHALVHPFSVLIHSHLPETSAPP
jgi:hypothetical protein